MKAQVKILQTARVLRPSLNEQHLNDNNNLMKEKKLKNAEQYKMLQVDVFVIINFHFSQLLLIRTTFELVYR